MSLELELARRVATTIKEAMTPVVARILTLEAQIRIPGPIGPAGRDGEKGLDGTNGRDGKDGASLTTDDVRPLVVAEVAKAVAAMPLPKDGASLTTDDVRPLIVTEVAKAVAAVPLPKDGASLTTDDVRPLIVTEVAKAVAAVPLPKDGAPGPPGRDGRDGQSIQGPPGEKGAAGVVESVPGLDPALITASADMLLRKEFAALEAAAPPRITKRVIRDARGKIERVVEEPTRS